MSGPRDGSELREILQRIDGRGYKAYKEIHGAWRVGGLTLEVEHAQGDPFATPSRLRVLVDAETAELPAHATRNPSRTAGTAALLARTFAEVAADVSKRRGSGRSGDLVMAHPGQLVIPQTAVLLSPEGSVEARFRAGLPARGRRVSGTAAVAMLLDDVPSIVRRSLLGSAHEAAELERHAATNEDADALREALEGRRLVAFVGDGARLPRRSGVDDRPLEMDRAVPFLSPPSMSVDIALPNAGTVSGMGIPEGVTLIVGGGFHGKSTLLRALQDGVYNHRPGDGRERTVTRSDAVKIRAEDGRPVAGVDISPFIAGLPMSRDTASFTTENASGSTSQAAAISEALEAGSRLLLVDEDTSATNFMIRDRRMQVLVPDEGEPITPFVDRVEALHRTLGVSTVLVLGGSGDYLDVADHVVRMVDYRPVDVSDEAREIARRLPTGRVQQSDGRIQAPAPRGIRLDSVDPARGRRATSVKVPDARTLLFGTSTVDLVAVEQLALRSQSRAIGLALAWAATNGALPDPCPLPTLLDAAQDAVARHGLDVLSTWREGELAAFRRFELAATLNRLRALRVD